MIEFEKYNQTSGTSLDLYTNQIFDRMNGILRDADEHYLKDQTVHTNHEKINVFTKDFVLIVEKSAFVLMDNLRHTYISIFDAQKAQNLPKNLSKDSVFKIKTLDDKI
jgi:hypothetical protein